VTQGPGRRTLRVLALGRHRGPPAEARSLYEETAVIAAEPAARWAPLLFE